MRISQALLEVVNSEQPLKPDVSMAIRLFKITRVA